MPPGIVFDAAAFKIKVTTSGWVQEIPLILWYLWLGTGNSAYPLVPLAGYRGIPLILWYLWLGTGEFRLSFGTSGWVQGNSACLLVNDGNENVAGKKTILRSFNLYRIYLDPPHLSNVGDFFSGV